MRGRNPSYRIAIALPVPEIKLLMSMLTTVTAFVYYTGTRKVLVAVVQQ